MKKGLEDLEEKEGIKAVKTDDKVLTAE